MDDRQVSQQLIGRKVRETLAWRYTQRVPPQQTKGFRRGIRFFFTVQNYRVKQWNNNISWEFEKGTICFTCTVNAHATVAYSSQRRFGMKPERMQSVLSRIIFKSAKMLTLMSHINLNSTLTRGSFITHTHTNIERKYFFKHCVTLLWSRQTIEWHSTPKKVFVQFIQYHFVKWNHKLKSSGPRNIF